MAVGHVSQLSVAGSSPSRSDAMLEKLPSVPPVTSTRSSQGNAAARSDSAAGPATEVREPEAGLSWREKLDALVEAGNDQARSAGRSLRFSVDEESGETIIRVVDKETGQLVRQIPPEEWLGVLERGELSSVIDAFA